MSPLACMNFHEIPANELMFTFQPLSAPRDKGLKAKRQSCKTSGNIFTIFPKNTLIRKEKKGERLGVCYTVAMEKALGLSDKQFATIKESIMGLEDWVTIIGMPYKFFNQQQTPQAGHLAAYSKGSYLIHHFGNVREDGRIRSKMGTSKYIVAHGYWDLPDWGDHLSFWELKPMYDGTDGKAQLFADIMNVIQNSQRMRPLLEKTQETLFNLAENKKIDKDFRNCGYNQPHYLIKGITGLDLNLPNASGNTALMLAAQCGNLDMVTILLEHNANFKIKNHNGNTALELAEKNNHFDVVNALNASNQSVTPKEIYYTVSAILIMMFYVYNNIL